MSNQQIAGIENTREKTKKCEITSAADLNRIKDKYNENLDKYRFQILICSGAGCISSNCCEVKAAVLDEISLIGMQNDVIVYETG